MTTNHAAKTGVHNHPLGPCPDWCDATNDAAERLLFTQNLTASGWVHAPADDVRAALAAAKQQGKAEECAAWGEEGYHRSEEDCPHVAAAKQQGATEADKEWRKIAAAAHDAGFNEAQGFTEVRIEEARRATVKRIRAAVEDIDPGVYITDRDVRDIAMPRILDAEAER